MPRWIQNPTTGELVPAEEYGSENTRTHAIHGDIEPFISHVDGSLIDDRGKLRRHNQRNNVVNMGDADIAAVQQDTTARRKEREQHYKQERLNTIINNVDQYWRK